MGFKFLKKKKGNDEIEDVNYIDEDVMVGEEEPTPKETKMVKRVRSNETDSDDRKRGAINSIIILLLFVSIILMVSMFNKNNNSNVGSKNNVDNFYTNNNSSVNVGKKPIEYLSGLNVKSATVFMLGDYYIMGVYKVSIPNFTYNIEVYSVDGTKLYADVKEDLTSNTLDIITYPNSNVSISPFVVIFFENPSFIRYVLIKDVKIEHVKVGVDMSTFSIINVTKDKIITSVNLTLNSSQPVYMTPVFNKVLSKYVDSLINMSLYKYYKVGNVYKLKKVMDYYVCLVNVGDVKSYVNFCPKRTLTIGTDNIFMLNVTSKNFSLVKPIRIGITYKLFAVYPVSVTVSNNSMYIKFVVLNPDLKSIDNIKVIYIANGSYTTKELGTLPMDYMNVIDVTLDDFTGGVVLVKVISGTSTTTFTFNIR